MDLQDKIHGFYRKIFRVSSHNNILRVSAVNGLIIESYDIYKCITYVLHHLNSQIGTASGALLQLKTRYDSQYARLLRFYAACATFSYTLRSLGSAAPELSEVSRNVHRIHVVYRLIDK